MRQLSIYIILVTLIIAGTSCKKEPAVAPTENAKTDQSPFKNAFFPLAVGNEWAYADTVYSIPDTVVSFAALTIIDSSRDEYGRWWHFRDSSKESESAYMQLSRGDSIFGYGPGWLGVYYPYLEYLDPGTQSLQYSTFAGGDVMHYIVAGPYNGVVETPGGNFSECIKYEHPLIAREGSAYFKRGIGPVAIETGYEILGGGSLTYFSRRLRSYILNSSDSSGESGASALFPMAYGNRWNFVDSTIRYGLVDPGTSGMAIRSSYETGSGTAWMFGVDSSVGYSQSFFGDGFIERNDSVFIAYWNYSQKPLLLAQLAATQDTLVLTSASGPVTIYRMTESYQTGAGLFTGCLEIKGPNFNYVFAPRVGIVGYSITNTPSVYSTDGHKGRLKSFHLQQ